MKIGTGGEWLFSPAQAFVTHGGSDALFLFPRQAFEHQPVGGFISRIHSFEFLNLVSREGREGGKGTDRTNGTEGSENPFVFDVLAGCFCRDLSPHQSGIFLRIHAGVSGGAVVHVIVIELFITNFLLKSERSCKMPRDSSKRGFF
jgi:hypothetical protein